MAGFDIPSLNFVECLELRNGNEDNDGLLSALDVNLSRSRDLQRSELSLEVGNVVLEVEKRLRDGQFDVIGCRGGSVSRSQDLAGSRRHAAEGDKVRVKQRQYVDPAALQAWKAGTKKKIEDGSRRSGPAAPSCLHFWAALPLDPSHAFTPLYRVRASDPSTVLSSE